MAGKQIFRCYPSVRVGQVIKKTGVNGESIAKVRIQEMKLDKHLLMYFPAKKDKWCIDRKKSRIGDIVVVRNLETRFNRTIFSKVDSIMYKVGATVDPVTGRRCRGTDFLDDRPRIKKKELKGPGFQHDSYSEMLELEEDEEDPEGKGTPV